MTDSRTEHVAIIEKHDRSERRAVLMPPGTSVDFDEGAATRRWLWPYISYDWHLIEIVKVQPAAVHGEAKP